MFTFVGTLLISRITAAVLPVRAPTICTCGEGLMLEFFAHLQENLVPHRRFRRKREVRLYGERLAAIVFRRFLQL